MKLLFRDVRADKRRAALQDLDSIARAEIERALEEVKATMIKSHEIIVADWKNKPGFDARKYIKPNKMEISVFPTGKHKDIWIYVDQGTKRHVITPKRANWLRFQWGGPGSYKPKTLARPARTVSGGGKVVGGVTVFRKRVMHPGTKARRFSETIAEDIKPDFKRLVENAFRRAADRIQEQP